MGEIKIYDVELGLFGLEKLIKSIFGKTQIKSKKTNIKKIFKNGNWENEEICTFAKENERIKEWILDSETKGITEYTSKKGPLIHVDAEVYEGHASGGSSGDVCVVTIDFWITKNQETKLLYISAANGVEKIFLLTKDEKIRKKFDKYIS